MTHVNGDIYKQLARRSNETLIDIAIESRLIESYRACEMEMMYVTTNGGTEIEFCDGFHFRYFILGLLLGSAEEFLISMKDLEEV